MNGLRDNLMEIILNSLNGFDKSVSQAQKVLNGASFDADDVWSKVVEFSEVLKPFCYVIISICLLIEIAQVAAKVDIIKWEMGLKLCIKMVLAKVCIDIAPVFLEACYKQSAAWVNDVANWNKYKKLGNMLTKPVTEQINQISGLWAIILLLVSCSILAMAIKVCGLLVHIIAFGRMFELYVLLAVSPIPCAFFPLGDGSGGGMSRVTSKFLKNFVAVCLQGVMMLVCIRVFNLIVRGSITNLINKANQIGNPTAAVNDLCYTMIMVGIVLVMAVTKCGSWAKSIMDAA